MPVVAKDDTQSKSRLPRLSLRHMALEIGKPDVGIAVRGRTPVAARRQGAAGEDLRPVRHGGAFELARCKETPQKHSQPSPDLSQLVGFATLSREIGRPSAA